MRKATLYLLLIAVLAFYTGAGGAAAGPYLGALASFVHAATAAVPTPRPTRPAPGIQPRAHATLAPGATPATPVGMPTAPAAPSPVAEPTSQLVHGLGPKKKPVASTQQLAEAVQHLAARSKIPKGRVNFLILGSDNDAKFASYSNPLTQVMIVVSIDTIHNTITLLSVPRDFWVHIPGYQYNVGPNGTSTGWNKIDVASKLGFNASACTIESNFGIPIDHWIWVGLNGFINVIDTVNGVTIDVPHPVIDDTYPDDLANPNKPNTYRRIYIPPGPQHLRGDAALHFVRSRHGDAQGDFGRSQRQQIVINQLRRMLLGQNGADLVALAPDLFKSFSGHIKTDPGLSPDLSTAAYYLSLLRSVGHVKPKQYVLQPPYSTADYWVYDHDPDVVATNGGQPVNENAVLPNWQLINPLIQRIFGGQSTATPHCSPATGASSPQ